MNRANQAWLTRREVTEDRSRMIKLSLSTQNKTKHQNDQNVVQFDFSEFKILLKDSLEFT